MVTEDKGMNVEKVPFVHKTENKYKIAESNHSCHLLELSNFVHGQKIITGCLSITHRGTFGKVFRKKKKHSRV